MKKSSFVSLFTILLLAVADVQEWTISSQSTVLNPSNTTTLLSTKISPSLYLSQNQNNAKNQTNNNDYKWLKFISEWKTIGSISGLLVLVFGVKSFPELVKLYKKKQIQRHRTQLHNTLKQLNEEESGELKDAFIKCIDETIDHKKILSDIFTDFLMNIREK